MNILFQLVAGLMLGYAIASCVESYPHRAFHHAGPRMRRLWAQYQMIGGPLRRAYFIPMVSSIIGGPFVEIL